MLEKAKDPASRGLVYKELFEESNSPNRCVASFLTEFVYNVFPPNFLEGCGKNKKVFNQRVYQFVQFNRFETFTRITLLEKFKIDDIGWLRFNSNHKNAKYFKRENEFVWWRMLKWIFEEILVSLMRCYFYATEKQKEYSRIFYYRKNVWHLVMKLGTEDLLQQNIMSVEKDEMRRKCASNNFAPAKLRLIPKGETFRPIMTFNRKLPHNRNSTTNKKLSPAHLMLKNLKSKMQMSGFGYAVFSYDEIMKKYEAFVNKWKAAGEPELYFVTMDIEKCYDSVDSRKVCELLRRTDLLDKEYYALSCIVLKRKNNVLVQKEDPVKEPIKNHFRHKFHKIGIDGGQYPALTEILGQENDYNFKRTLVVEQEHRKKLFKKDLLTPIDYIIQNNYITFNKSQYKQTKGIPQGMCVSYILSSFYYACLEE